jgi:IclR family transcriptional regulator, KDG regulon repressor
MSEKRLIQSIKRASDILEMFLGEKKPIGITEFSKRLGLAKTTVSSIAVTLDALGFLEKERITGRYRLGPKIFELGMKCATGMDVITLGRAWIERLCFQFMEPVNVGVLVGDKVTIIMRTEPGNRYMVFPEAGSVIPIHSTSIGKTLLAYIDNDKREAILRDYRFEKFTPQTIDNRKAFLKELEQVKRDGISHDRQESINGLAGIGGPIFNHEGALIAAFAISGNPRNIEKRKAEIIAAVRLTSRQISSQLGCPEDI